MTMTDHGRQQNNSITRKATIHTDDVRTSQTHIYIETHSLLTKFENQLTNNSVKIHVYIHSAPYCFLPFSGSFVYIVHSLRHVYICILKPVHTENFKLHEITTLY